MKTAWPEVTDVASIVSAMGVTMRTAISTAIQTNILNACISNFNARTRRTWLPVTETRYFNGSDSGMIEVDEYTEISTVEIIGWYGITSGMVIDSIVEVDRANYPKTKIQIYRNSLPGLYRVWVDRFPAGRSNIKITADWGYATTVPDDVWWGVAYQAAGILINISNYATDGFNIKWQEADVTEVRMYMDPFTFFKTGTTYKGLCNLYRRPASFALRKQAKPLV
jgi:hypothetical protein